MSRYFCLGGCCVSSGVSLHLVLTVGVGDCRGRLWPASVCLKMGEKGRREKEGGGTKCSSVPKTPHPLEVCVVFVALVLECGDEE